MLFGSSGVRRLYGRDLCEISLALGASIGHRAGCVLLGRDTRTTSPLIADLVAAGILGAGGDVRDAGVVPTPVIGYGARSCDFGVMVTASHNPEEYNGIKVFSPDGSSLSLEKQLEIEAGMGALSWGTWDRQGDLGEVDACTPYIGAVLEQRSSVSGVHLVLDCGNGAGSRVSPALLSWQGVDLTCVSCNPAGRFARPSEPTAENLAYLGGVVREREAAGAVVHDGDADRMMAFDGRGRFISGDHLLMLFVRYLGVNEVVTTTDASMAIEELATVRRTPVGDSYVSRELARWGGFGGEPSGAWIFPDHSLCPDGPYAAALFAEMASEWEIADEVDSLPSYPLIRESLPCDRAREVLLALGAGNPTDGIRIEDEQGWCLVRASGTEPKIRLTAEGKDMARAKEMLRKGRDLVARGKVLKGAG